MEFLENLWKNQRTLALILGTLLLPITLLIIGYKIYMFFNAKSAEDELKGAQSQSDKIVAEENALKKQSNQAVDDANKAAQKIEDRHADDAVDLDWNTKRKD